LSLLRYYITDRKSAGAPILQCISLAIAQEVDFIQIREKDLPARELCELAKQACKLSLGSKTRILINTRTDVALASGAAGVHLPSNSLSSQLVRGIVPQGFLIFASCHTLEELQRSESEGADAAVFGPVFDSGDKLGQGLGALKQAVAGVRIPVLALGGVNEGNAELCVSAGAAGIAGIRTFQERYASLWNRD
jgi:thiamine-phosphate pyrophosphorylase